MSCFPLILFAGTMAFSIPAAGALATTRRSALLRRRIQRKLASFELHGLLQPSIVELDPQDRHHLHRRIGHLGTTTSGEHLGTKVAGPAIQLHLEKVISGRWYQLLEYLLQARARRGAG